MLPASFTPRVVQNLNIAITMAIPKLKPLKRLKGFSQELVLQKLGKRVIETHLFAFTHQEGCLIGLPMLLADKGSKN